MVDVILRLLLWGWKEARVGDRIGCLSYAPQCDVIAAGSPGGELFFINAQTGEKNLCPVSCGSRVYCLAFHDSMIAVGCDNAKINLFTLGQSGDSGEIRSELPLSCFKTTSGFSCSPVLSIAFKDNMIAAGCSNGMIKLFALKQSGDWGEIQSDLDLSCGSWVNSIALKDNMIAAGCDDGKIKVYALKQSGNWGEMQSETTLWDHGQVTSLDFSPCGTRIAANFNNYDQQKFEIKFFHLNPQSRDWEIQPRSTLMGHQRPVSGVVFHPEKPNILVSCSWDQTIKIWDITSGSCLSTLTGHSSAVVGVAFSADGRRLISGSADGMVRLWDAHAGATSLSAV